MPWIPATLKLLQSVAHYVWRKKQGGLGPSDLKRLRRLKKENRKFKQLNADLSLSNAMLQEVVKKL